MDRSRCVAVIGAACRFPGGENLDEFWNMLINRENHVKEIPPDRWNVDEFYSPDKEAVGKTYVRHAALLKDIRCFDNKIFNITDEEARYMDVQQKLTLEVAYKALESAGLSLNDVRGTDTAVFMGQMNEDYARSLRSDEVNTFTGTGLGRAIMSNRVSYQFDLRGASATVDTACSSSLLCLHLGLQSILTGESTMALCGGVSAILSPYTMISLSKAGMASLKGQCHAFSDSADGYVRGEGCGVIVIKQLDQAIRDKNEIWCILTTGTNQDGRTVSPLSSPSSIQQEALIRRMYEDCSIKLELIDFIEAHGTGTKAGDPAETQALGNTIGTARRNAGKGPCPIGSLKSNIGHLESAAGVAGVIKIILMLKHRKLVPTVLFNKLNPDIDFEGLHLSFCDRVSDWFNTDNVPRLACVNSFGYGGTNVHAVLEEYNEHKNFAKENKGNQSRPWPVLISAASAPAVEATLKHALNFANSSACDFQSLAYTSAAKRTHFPYRIGMLASNLDEWKKLAEERLTALQRQPESLNAVPRSVRVVFAFCGMGTTYTKMGSELFRLEPVFADTMREIDQLVQKFTGWSVIEKINGDDRALGSPEFSQPALFAIQVSVAKLLESWGIKPDDIIGHSVGEVAASCVAKRLSLEDATKVICQRGRIVAKVSGGSMMVAENFPSHEVEKILQIHSAKLCTAAINSANCFTLSGDTDAIEDAERRLKVLQADGSRTLVKKLDVNTAFHSHHMEPILSELRNSLAGIKTLETDRDRHPTPVYSTVTGKLAVDGDLSQPEYWVRNTRGSVQFQQAFTECIKATTKTNTDTTLIVEIGPRPALGRYMKEISAANQMKSTVFATLKSPAESFELYSTLTRLHENGLDIFWKEVFRGNETEMCPIPQYQYHKKNLWHDIAELREIRGEQVNKKGSNDEASVDSNIHCFLRKLPDDKTTFVIHLNAPETDFVNEHQLTRIPTVPGAMYLESGLAAVLRYANARLERISITVNFQRLLMLSPNSDQEKVMEITVSQRNNHQTEHVVLGASYDFEIVCNGIQHASGSADISEDLCVFPTPVDLPEIRRRCSVSVDQQSLYARLSTWNFSYGMRFRMVQSCLCSRDGSECLAFIHVCEEVSKYISRSVLHPCIGDAVLQLSCIFMNAGQNSAQQYVPRCIRKVRVLRRPEQSMLIYLTLTSYDSDNHIMTYNATMVNAYGEVYVTFESIIISATNADVPCHVRECLHFVKWKPYAVLDQSDTKHPEKNSDSLLNGNYIIFEDKMGIARRFTEIVKKKGISISGFKFLTQDRNFIESFHDDMNCLDRRLPKSLTNYSSILYFWPVDAALYETMTADEVRTVVIDMCFSLCQIVKCIMLAGAEIEVTVVTRNVCELMHNSSDIQQKAYDGSLPIDVVTRTNFLRGVVGHTIITTVRTLKLEPGCPPIRCIDLTRCDDEDVQLLIRELLYRDPNQKMDFSIFQEQLWTPQLFPGYVPFDPPVRRVTYTKPVPYEVVKSQRARFTISPVSALKTRTPPKNNGHTYIPCEMLKIRIDDTHLIYGTEVLGNDVAEDEILAVDMLACTSLAGKKSKDNKMHILGPCTLESIQYIDSRRCIPYSLLPIDQPVISLLYIAWYIAECTNAGKLLGRKQTKIVSSDAGSDIQIVKRLLDRIFRKKDDVKAKKSSEHFTVTLTNVKKLTDIVDLIKKAAAAKTCLLVLTDRDRLPAQKTISIELLETMEFVSVPRLFDLENAKFFEKFRHWLKNQSFFIDQVKSIIERHMDIRTLNSETDCFIEVNTHEIVLSSKPTISILDFSLYNKTIPLALSPSTLFRPTSHYVIVGGTRGLGWELIKHMASLGAKYLVSWSRKPPENTTRSEAEAIEVKHNCKIRFQEVEVSVNVDVARALKACREVIFPRTELGGVFHGAVVLDDTAVITMDLDRYNRALLPKVNGTWNLHQLTKDRPVDYFVFHSSVAAVVGNPGQTNYTAGNAFQDGLAVYRRKIGLSGQSIGWSSLAVGVIQQSQAAVRRTMAAGLYPLSVADILECFDYALLSDHCHPVFARILWRQLFRQRSTDKSMATHVSFFQVFVEKYKRFFMTLSNSNEKSASEAVNSNNGGNQGNVDNVRAFIRLVFMENVPGFEDRPTDNVDAYELGADSLHFLSITNKIRKQFGVPDTELQGTAFPTLTVDRMYDIVVKYTKPLTTSSLREISDEQNSVEDSSRTAESMNATVSRDDAEMVTRL